MLTIVSGVGLLLVTLAGFSLFSLKMPKGQLAMSGMANAAIATFLVEAVHKYITGDLLGLDFFRTVGSTSGSLGGVAAAIMVPISMGTSPVLAVVAGVAVGGYGILPGFIAGYVIGLIAPVIEKRLPEGLNIIGGALLIAPGTFDRSGRRSGCKRRSGAYRRHDRRCHGTVSHRHGIPAGRHHQDDLYLPAKFYGADCHAGS